jgi:diaminopimelate epimerase
MCGNGGRCIAKFSHDIGITYQYNCFLAIDGPHDFSITKDGMVRLKMKDINAIEKAGDDYIMDTGSPHYVQFIGRY